MVQFHMEASQTRVILPQKARQFAPDPSLRKTGLLRMTIELHHYPHRLDFPSPAPR
jgi:hypothetical protein